ncbi:Actin filament-associated protein 1 [Microtus ochrogaster]|uniref:Actin filament-associated protein 1 n=1 Tax=Microtus ochrogaster TaxID=79684 RepID=A0A8J6GRV0_MICOH|nr:Actin filament-associated protein 1 [Microtus ochrogaster]
MEELIVELRLFLELLDHEYLTSTVREKKAVLTNILLRIQSSSKGFEVKDHAQKAEANSLPAPPQMPLPEIPQPWLPPDSGPPPLPTSSLPEGYYEEAVPLSPGKAPEYITSNYDSDAMSSSYESYDEEEEDGKGKKTRHQWPSEEASMDLVKDAKICAFLLRKKRFGQWTKLLCVIKDTKLLCYKSSKDQQPQMELPLQGCSITYIPRDSKKKKHELKITQQGTDPLVLAVQSKEQAEQWLKVIKEAYSGCSGPVDPECSPPPSASAPVNKAELEKKLSSERPSSDGEGIVENGVTTCNGKEQVKRKKTSKSDAKGTVSKVTGKKITNIIGLGKKKPSTDEQTSSAEEDVPTCDSDTALLCPHHPAWGPAHGSKAIALEIRAVCLGRGLQQCPGFGESGGERCSPSTCVSGGEQCSLSTCVSGGEQCSPSTYVSGGEQCSPSTYVSGGEQCSLSTCVSGGERCSPSTHVSGGERGSPSTYVSGGERCSLSTCVSGGERGSPSTYVSGGERGSPSTYVSGGEQCSPSTYVSGGERCSPSTYVSGGERGSPSTYVSGGYLNVLSNSRWRERWCRVKDSKLIFHKDRADLKTHIVSIPLRGCEVIPGLDSKHPLTFRLLRNGQEVAVLEASSSEDMGRWIGILLAETGSSTDPGALHYDYIDVEMSANVIQTAKQTFCFMNRRAVSTSPYLGSISNGYAHPSGTALHYDDVPCVNGSLRPAWLQPPPCHQTEAWSGCWRAGVEHSHTNAGMACGGFAVKQASTLWTVISGEHCEQGSQSTLCVIMVPSPLPYSCYCTIFKWDTDGGFPGCGSRGLAEEVLYDNAGLYDNLPSPTIFARSSPADRRASRPPADRLSSNHYKSPTSCSPPCSPPVTNTSSVGRASLGLHSQLKSKKPPVASNGVSIKGKVPSSQQKKVDSAGGVKRTASNADQYKYGKNRVEADAKLLQSKEEELLKRKEALRNRLAQLRKERKDLRAAIEVNAGRKTQVSLEDKLKRLEEECKQREAERVSLELELTEVKESLKKALAGGVTLGLAIEPRSGTSSPQSPVFRHRTLENSPISSCDTSDAEGPLPVNSAAVLKKSQASSGNSPCRGHVLQKAKTRDKPPLLLITTLCHPLVKPEPCTLSADGWLVDREQNRCGNQPREAPPASGAVVSNLSNTVEEMPSGEHGGRKQELSLGPTTRLDIWIQSHWVQAPGDCGVISPKASSLLTWGPDVNLRSVNPAWQLWLITGLAYGRSEGSTY